MKDFVKQNVIQWHREQRDRANAFAANESHSAEKRAEAVRSADRHAKSIKELSDG